MFLRPHSARRPRDGKCGPVCFGNAAAAAASSNSKLPLKLEPQVSIALLLLFTVVMLQNDRLMYQLGGRKSSYGDWQAVLQAALIVYAVCVMTMLMAAQCEQGGQEHAGSAACMNA